MNRQNTDNLVENLLDFEYELKKPYLLYRNAAQEVNGIWFYNEDECEEDSILNGFAVILIFHLCHRIWFSMGIEKEAEAKIQGAVKLLKFTGCSKFPFSL
ncbi:mRNA-decapping enzyme-like protein [Arachis hypogaea]|uniref:mRNA-decapping enzyme-like protein n=1 Tax=Arachis hypogaea TaxID=3818 RepID=UPI003B20EF78|nr:mRNA-decapping enzyme-like protein [Arachis hypogaea]